MIGWAGRCLTAFFGLLWLSAPEMALAQPPSYEVYYQKARGAYYRFKKEKEKKKFRHNWQNLAHLFEEVARKFPNSPRAPDALYTAGRLHHDLYLISRVPEDLDRSLSWFRGLVERFPSDHLADDAQLYCALKWVEYVKNPQLARQELSFLVKRFPDGDVTPKARRMLQDLGGPLEETQEEGAAMPGVSKERPDAGTEEEEEREVKDAGEDAGVEAEPVGEVRSVLEKIRHWSNPGYTRISLYTRTSVRFKVGKLPEDKRRNFSKRLYVDLLDCKLSNDLSGPIPIRDSVVRSIRFAKRSGRFIRVVLDLDADRDYRVFPMTDPARVVIDISRGEEAADKAIGEKPAKTGPRPKKKIDSLKAKSQPGASLSMLAGLKVKRVVIDPGHGGADPGAIGPGGSLEKEITLDIVRKLQKIFKKSLKLEVLLTRNSDRFMALEERTAFANQREADLFISIHLNAHQDRRFHGVETFYLDITDDRYSIKLAARENATSEKSISDLQYILADLALKSHVDDSISLSRSVQMAMVGHLMREYGKVRDLGVKPALFFVLIGARMPSILVEASFISNPQEEKQLTTRAYRQKLAEGIFVGIKNFIDERNRMIGPGE